MKKLILYTLVIMALRHVSANKSLMSIVLQRCTSYCNPEYCKVLTVCRPLNRTSKLASIDIYLHPGVTLKAPIYIGITAFKKFTTVYRPHMIKLKTELCEQLSFRTHPIFGLTKLSSEFGNMLEPCPISGHRYTKQRITNSNDHDSTQLRLVPAGEWRLDTTVTLKRNGSEVVLVSLSDYYEIKALTAEEF